MHDVHDVHDALTALAHSVTAAAAGTPTAPPVDPELVTPGPWGFIAIVFVALAVIVLVWDMMRRIRRGRVRADINEELEAEEQAARATDTTDIDEQRIDPDEPEQRPRG